MGVRIGLAACGAVLVSVFGANESARGAGFALTEQGGGGMGSAFAGAAAVAEDASTIFFNPAGMTRLRKIEFVGGASAIDLDAKFSGSATRPAALGGGSATGGDGGNAGGIAAVPALYLAVPIGDRLAAGVGVSVPFGLKTEYDETWVGRFHGIKSEVRTININPAIAFRATDAISLGIGLNYQRIDTELTNAVVAPLGEGRTRLEADDDSWGWNAGVLVQASEATRIGASYRSGIRHTLTGNVSTTNPNGSSVATGTGAASAGIELPAIYSLSAVQSVGTSLDILADITYTHWSSVQQVSVVNPAGGAVRDVLNFNFDNSWRYSVGANYRLSEAWTLRTGIAYDQTPVKDAQSRTVRLPDADRTWLAFGARWNLSSSMALDFAYAHLFLKDVSVDTTRSQLAAPTVTASRVTGSFNGSVNLLSVQFVQRF